MINQDFLVQRDDLSNTSLVDSPTISAGDGEVMLALEKFALTANNITYGVAGDSIGYWQFFPAPDGFGRIPVWGIGKVAASNHPAVSVGDRYYGYYPMSHQLKVKPEKVTSRGLFDSAEHRGDLPAVYNQYSLMTPANGFEPARDNHQMIYRPLFTTSFVLDDYLRDNDFFGADTVILGSASSKTAFGLAFMLHGSRAGAGVRVVGLTSAQNAGFVASLGLYDEVVTYEDAATLACEQKAAYVDMSGNRQVLAAVHHHFGDKLVASCGVGATHWGARDGEDPRSLPGARPTMFFAPTQIQKRNQEWGPAEYQAKIAAATNDFFARVDDWVTINERPFTQVSDVYDEVLNGASPDQAYVVTLQP